MSPVDTITALMIAWLATAIGLGIATLLVPGVKANSLLAFTFAATALSLINAFIRPVLWLLTAPLSVLTFGLFALFINALMILLAATLVPGFTVKGFGSAFLAALVMAIVGIVGFIAISVLTGADISWSSYEYHSQTFTP